MANEDREYQDHLRQLDCAMAGHGDCIGAVHVHHSPGRKGLGQRNADDTGKPLCAKHHTERHALSGAFKGMAKEALRDWERDTAELYRRVYLGLGPDDDF